MKTIDIHTHLLSSDVAFDRFYDKLALRFFRQKVRDEPKSARERSLRRIHPRAGRVGQRLTARVEKIVLFGVDARVDEAGRDPSQRHHRVCDQRGRGGAVPRERGCHHPLFLHQPQTPRCARSHRPLRRCGICRSEVFAKLLGGRYPRSALSSLFRQTRHSVVCR
jgi:hypothetical protein